MNFPLIIQKLKRIPRTYSTHHRTNIERSLSINKFHVSSKKPKHNPRKQSEVLEPRTIYRSHDRFRFSIIICVIVRLPERSSEADTMTTMMTVRMHDVCLQRSCVALRIQVSRNILENILPMETGCQILNSCVQRFSNFYISIVNCMLIDVFIFFLV